MYIKDILTKNKDLDKVAIKEGNKVVTYNLLYKMVNENVDLLCKKQCFSKNIGIFLPNSIQYAIAYFTISFLNSVIVPIDIKSKITELRSIIRYCDLKLIITNSTYSSLLKKLLRDSDTTVMLFNLEDKSFEVIGDYKSHQLSFCNYIIPKNENDVAIMLHTSGTTSNPKRVMLSHKNLISNINSNIISLNITKEDKVLIALPMFFGYCNTAQFLTYLFLGGTIIIMKGLFIPNEFFKLIEKERITSFTGVPSMLLLLLNPKISKKYDISSLKIVCFGGGTMPVNKLKELINEFPSIGFVQTYGQTEASPRVTALLPKDSKKKIGSVGKAIYGVKVKIINKCGNEVEPGEIGEIIVQGENVMLGYYKRPEETAKVLKNNWLFTGDLGRYDDDGYIYIVGRKKNVILSGGINIYPEEIESVLMCHPAIKSVCIFGEFEKYLGEVPIAKVVLNDGYKSINQGMIQKYCKEIIADYKIPRKVMFVNKLEKTVTGKIRRY